MYRHIEVQDPTSNDISLFSQGISYLTEPTLASQERFCFMVSDTYHCYQLKHLNNRHSGTGQRRDLKVCIGVYWYSYGRQTQKNITF